MNPDRPAVEPPKIRPPQMIDVPATVTPIDPVRPTPIPEPPRSPGGAPVHPLAALLMIGVDNLWNLADWAVIDWLVTVPLCFFSVLVPVFFVQKLVMKDRTRRAFAFAVLLGAIAAVPTSITGTPVGLALLAWTGISKLLGKPVERP